MELLNVVAVLITLSALFSFVNCRFLKLPRQISLVLASLVLALLLLALGRIGAATGIEAMVLGIDFNQTVLVGMLSFLLFAGALHVDLNDLLGKLVEVSVFATAGVLLSTAFIGVAVWLLFQALGTPVPLLHGLLFGALISPTDPIAVLGILRKAGTPKSLEIKMTGESLFNDGIGVVVFLVLLSLAAGGGHGAHVPDVAWLLLKEVGGGAAVGLAAGLAAFWLLRQVDDYVVEILITLALVTGGYALALNLHSSGPIAVVLAGLLIGNHGRRLAMSDRTREHLDTFWELVDEILNSVLFVLIGLEILAVALSGRTLLLGLLAIPVALAGRFVSVAVPVTLLRSVRTFSPRILRVLTWGGLRGGISVALALSLPAAAGRDLFLPMTYAVVLFSLVVQGLTVGRVAGAGKAGKA